MSPEVALGVVAAALVGFCTGWAGCAVWIRGAIRRLRAMQVEGDPIRVAVPLTAMAICLDCSHLYTYSQRRCSCGSASGIPLTRVRGVSET